MSAEQIRGAALIAGIICLSGASESQGYVYAANIWQNGNLIGSEIAKSGLGFGGSIIAYWLSLKYLTKFGILSPEFQTMIWFSVTIVGVAVVSGRFFDWQTVDQLIACFVLAGIVWLLVRRVG